MGKGGQVTARIIRAPEYEVGVITSRAWAEWWSVTRFFFVFFVGWDLLHQVLRPLLAYCTAPNDRWGWLWSNWWNEDWQGKPKYSEKTCPSAILSTTNPTRLDPCANTGRRGGKPATNRLSYGAATTIHLLLSVIGLIYVSISETELSCPQYLLLVIHHNVQRLQHQHKVYVTYKVFCIVVTWWISF
jgi:hypothetical protein